MKDKLIELIKSRRDPCDIGACPFVGDDVRPCSLCEAESLAEHLIANGVTVGDAPETNVWKWIPVSERLPEEDEIYLISVNSDTKGIYSRTAWYFTQNEQWLAMQEVTHWMPMPEPPKEGE